MARRKKTHNDVQNTKQKTKDQAKLKTGQELSCSERVSSSCPTSGTRRVTIK